MGFKINNAPRKKPKIEVIPLIDIMFFLFAVVLMISLSMTQNQGINVPVPPASSSDPQNSKDKDSVTVSVTDKGEIFVGREKVSIAQLGFKFTSLKNSAKNPKDAKVVVNGAGDAALKYVIQVIDEAKKVGITNVVFSTAKK